MRRHLRNLGAALLLSALALPAAALELGDEAPELDVTEWVKGGPVTITEGKPYVIGFWATWKDDGKAALEIFKKLQEKYPTKLLVLAITDEPGEDVKAFLADKTFPLAFATDTSKNTTGVYRMAVGAGEKLPYVFIVDAKRRVAWHGDPEDAKLHTVLAEVVEGKYDIERAKRVEELRLKLMQSLATRSVERIEKAADALLEVEPGDAQAIQIKGEALRVGKDPEKYLAFVRERVPAMTEAGGLNDIAWALATDARLAWRDIALAHKAAKRAAELSDWKDGSIIDTYARVLFEAGMLEKAVEEQRKAVAVAKSDTDVNDEQRKGLADTLAYYESCVALKKELGAGTPPKKR